jgi:hypothetical protein
MSRAPHSVLMVVIAGMTRRSSLARLMPSACAACSREWSTLPAAGRPDPALLVFPDSEGGHPRRQNWRRRVWMPALDRAGIPYFRSYDLRHTCATLLLYEGRTLNEVAEHLGHADPGFTARTYVHVMRDAYKRRRISEAIRKARVGASRRPLVDRSALKPATRAKRWSTKSLQIEKADAGTRTPDPFITSEVLRSAASMRRRPLTGEPTGKLNLKALQIADF